MSKKFFKRPCNRCNKLFTPTGKFQRICENCNPRLNKKALLKTKYFKTKEELDIIRSNATLTKWKALSRAYSLGKKIWGSKFTRQRLSNDMDIPMTTVLRCLSLDRANKKSWKAVSDGKISVFKLAMICQLKSKTYQDEIIDIVIRENYSTYQIKSLKVNNIKDINEERLRLAVKSGYSRKSSAADNFERWIERGKLLLLLKKSALSKERYKSIREELVALNKRIERYLDD